MELFKDKITLYHLSENPSETRIRQILDNKLKAGFPSPALDYAVDSIDLNKLLIQHPASTFLAEVDGVSMINAFISNPALLLIDRALVARNNDIILASVDGDYTVKFYHRKGDKITLKPANPLYKDTQIVDGMEFQVWGVVSRIIIEPRKIF